jgi:type IV secretory pathway VirB10-like protein
MSDTNPSTAPQIQDNRSKPPGVLPKNTQAWVLSGIALLMVGVIALSGKNPPKARVDPTVQSPLDPNAARIQEYQKRIEEQARKLQFEQAQLAHTQQTLGLASNGPATPTPSYPVGYPPSVYSRPAEFRSTPELIPAEDSIQADRKKREYQSLFASNIALSYRKDIAAAQEPLPATSATLARGLPLYGYPYPPGPEAAGGRATLASAQSSSPPARQDREAAPPREITEGGDVQDRKRQPNYAELQRAEGKQYRLFEGTVFETVLTNRLDGSFSGPANCMVTTNKYSHDGQHVLVPQGTRVLGEVRKVQTFGDQRLAVCFHRLIMPDGYSVSLDKFEGLNQIGETGLRDQVNHHYLQVFGVSLAIGAIAGLSQANTRYGLDESATDAYRQGVTSSLSQSSLRILDRYLNVLPTFTIREGHRVKIYLSNDLLLPAYEKHQMPSDL